MPWFGVAKPRASEVKNFLGLSWWFLAWRLIFRLLTSSDVILLGILASVELVAAYSLTKYVPETLVSFVAIVVNAIMPGLGGIMGSDNLQKAVKVRNEIMSLIWLIATVVGTTVLLGNYSFVQIWVGAEFYVGLLPNLLIIVMMVQFVLLRADANIIDLSLDLKKKVPLGLFAAALAVGLAAVLVNYFDLGITGFCIGFILGRMVLSIGYPLIVSGLLNVSFKDQVKNIIRPTLVTVSLFIGAAYFSEALQVNNWFALIFYAGVTGVVALLVTFAIGLQRDRQTMIIKRTQSLIKR